MKMTFQLTGMALFAITAAYAQFSVVPNPTNSQLVCPGNTVDHTVIPSGSDYVFCSVQWTNKNRTRQYPVGIHWCQQSHQGYVARAGAQ